VIFTEESSLTVIYYLLIKIYTILTKIIIF